QEKNDSIYQFFDFKPEKSLYEADFQKRITQDSILYQTLDSLKIIGYYTLKLDSVRDQNIYLNKGKMYKNIWVKNDTIFQQNEEWFAVKKLDSVIQKVSDRYAERGFPFTELKIRPLSYKDGEAQVALDLQLFGAR